MITYTQLSRLIILTTVTSALVFLFLAGYAKYEENEANTTVNQLHKHINDAYMKCESDKTSIYCETIDLLNNEFYQTVATREQHNENAKTYFALSLAIPLLSLFLWFAGRWVMTGKIKSVE